jgi:hypothetical protein
MANFCYSEYKHQLLAASINHATADIRVALVMTNTTANTEQDKTTVGGGTGFTTLDEYDGTGYTSPGQALANKTVTQDTTNHRGVFDADDLTWTALAAGTRQCKAALVYKFVTSLAASLPIAYIDTGGFPFAGNGSNVTLQFNVGGIIQTN